MGVWVAGMVEVIRCHLEVVWCSGTLAACGHVGRQRLTAEECDGANMAWGCGLCREHEGRIPDRVHSQREAAMRGTSPEERDLAVM